MVEVSRTVAPWELRLGPMEVLEDALTGLPNHRAFRERLQGALRESTACGGVLAVAIVDVEHLGAINVSAGYAAGDRVLAEVARSLARARRPGDLVARVGGDEFALLFRDTSAEAAAERVEAVQRRIGLSPATSAGICDTTRATGADALLRMAGDALRWARAHGAGAARVFEPRMAELVPAVGPALHGVRALARVVDAKDPTTLAHSTRVTAIAGALARRLGWSLDRVDLLCEAALVHDVGKVGVPDAVLFSTSRLTPTQYDLVKRHAEIGAEICAGLLLPEQVEWIRHHHERPDGRGYPDGLTGARISAGSAILAVADAFDVMTTQRPYSHAKSYAEALRECEALAEQQFLPEPVAALQAVFDEATRPNAQRGAVTLASGDRLPADRP